MNAKLLITFLAPLYPRKSTLSDSRAGSVGAYYINSSLLYVVLDTAVATKIDKSVLCEYSACAKRPPLTTLPS